MIDQPKLFDDNGNPTYEPPPGKFNGPVYEARFDYERLRGQMLRVFNLMRDGRWRTLTEIEHGTGDPAASISAQLRHLRKPRFGSHTVEKRPRGERIHGLFEYQLIVEADVREET